MYIKNVYISRKENTIYIFVTILKIKQIPIYKSVTLVTSIGSSSVKSMICNVAASVNNLSLSTSTRSGVWHHSWLSGGQMLRDALL